MNFITTKNIDLLEHPPYSPDMAPCDFWAFPQIKKNLAGYRFGSQTELEVAVQGVLRQLSENGLLFVFEDWAKCGLA